MKLMTPTPVTVLLIGALSLAVGWWAGTSTTSNQLQEAPAALQRSGARPSASADDVAPFTGQLRQRLDARPPRTPSIGRNPFTFSSRRPSPVALQRAETMADTVSVPVPFTPPAPQFKLSGIAVQQDAETVVLTAIINDNGSLAFVKTGDKLSNGFSVIRVDETTVVIIDTAGVTQTLRLP